MTGASVAGAALTRTSLFKLICPTRNYGLGKKVTRGIWDRFPEPSYWEVTRVRPSPDLKHGKVYGRLTFRGKTLENICIQTHI